MLLRLGLAPRFRTGGFAEDEELDERADEENDRQLAEKEALRKRQPEQTSGISNHIRCHIRALTKTVPAAVVAHLHKDIDRLARER